VVVGVGMVEVVVVVGVVLVVEVVVLVWVELEVAASCIASAASPSSSSFSVFCLSSCEEATSSSEQRKEPMVLMHVPAQFCSTSSTSHSSMSVFVVLLFIS
jgi:hypothetical protein